MLDAFYCWNRVSNLRYFKLRPVKCRGNPDWSSKEVYVNFRFSIQFLVALWLWPPAGMADLEAGLTAHARGDYDTALNELRPLAEAGNARAQSKLGTMYINGEGVPEDAEEGVRWYRKSAEQGFVDGQFNLGSAYASGRGVAKDDAEAARWYRMAAEQGDAEAQATLGAMFHIGIGVRRNSEKALRWYREAANQGFADAQVALGVMYYQGDGVPRDSLVAAEWFRKSAMQGVAEAQWLLGQMYANGDGVAQDNVRAYAWLLISTSGEDQLGRDLLQALADRMSASQIEAARQLSVELAAEVRH